MPTSALHQTRPGPRSKPSASGASPSPRGSEAHFMVRRRDTQGQEWRNFSKAARDRSAHVLRRSREPAVAGQGRGLAPTVQALRAQLRGHQELSQRSRATPRNPLQSRSAPARRIASPHGEVPSSVKPNKVRPGLARGVSSRAVRPNTSLKLSPNGGPRGPGRRYAVHFRQPGPRVPPSVPT